MENHENLPVKWLQYLFYVHIASVVISLTGWLSSGDMTFWLGRAVTFGIMVCLFNMESLGARYKKAAIIMAVNLVLVILNRFLVSDLFSLAVSVLPIFAAYQEYNGHSELVAGRDEELSRAWHNLFGWEIGVGVLTFVLTLISAVIFMMGEIGTAAITGIITILVLGVSLVLGVLYLVYLHRTMKLFEN